MLPANWPGLMTLEAASGSELKGLDNAWKGAEAYHFWLLAHQQLYNGQVGLASALKTLHVNLQPQLP
jgi:WD repeat-containing protein 35